jgi:hypothetical protein
VEVQGYKEICHPSNGEVAPFSPWIIWKITSTDHFSCVGSQEGNLHPVDFENTFNEAVSDILMSSYCNSHCIASSYTLLEDFWHLDCPMLSDPDPDCSNL